MKLNFVEKFTLIFLSSFNNFFFWVYNSNVIFTNKCYFIIVSAIIYYIHILNIIIKLIEYYK